MDKVDLFAAKEAAKLLDGFGTDLLTNMSPQAAFHAMAAAAVVFGIKLFGAQQAAAWLRILADELDRRGPLN